jgi:hypothetical protein
MTLHIHAQQVWHDDAYIVGTPKSLRILADGIEKALANESSISSLIAGDGKSFILKVFVRDEPYMNSQASLPYTDKITKENRPLVTYPWKEEH